MYVIYVTIYIPIEIFIAALFLIEKKKPLTILSFSGRMVKYIIVYLCSGV